LYGFSGWNDCALHKTSHDTKRRAHRKEFITKEPSNAKKDISVGIVAAPQIIFLWLDVRQLKTK